MLSLESMPKLIVYFYDSRMSPLSKDLSGIILPHDHYGNHLGPSGETVDRDLELQNLEKAGNCLAEIGMNA